MIKRITSSIIGLSVLLFGIIAGSIWFSALVTIAGALAARELVSLANKTSEALETGMVAVNTPFISNAETPFGGVKQSGYGREGGSVGIKDYLNIKYTHLGLLG